MLAIQCKMARVALGIAVRELAEMAKVSPDTVARLERGEVLKERTIESIQHTLEAAGVIFIDENGEGPGVRLKKAAPNTSDLTEQIEAQKDKIDSLPPPQDEVSPEAAMDTMRKAVAENDLVDMKNVRTRTKSAFRSNRMARKPNYDFERREREKAKAIKAAERVKGKTGADVAPADDSAPNSTEGSVDRVGATPGEDRT